MEIYLVLSLQGCHVSRWPRSRKKRGCSRDFLFFFLWNSSSPPCAPTVTSRSYPRVTICSQYLTSVFHFIQQLAVGHCHSLLALPHKECDISYVSQMSQLVQIFTSSLCLTACLYAGFLLGATDLSPRRLSYLALYVRLYVGWHLQQHLELLVH